MKFAGMSPVEIISTMSRDDSIKALAFTKAFFAGNRNEADTMLDGMSKEGLGVFIAFMEASIAEKGW